MIIHENFNLKDYNTFGIAAHCSYFAQCTSIEEIQEALRFATEKQQAILILGGGSNVLFTKDWDGIVIQPLLKGIELLEENEDYLLVEAAAGEKWEDFVRFCVENDWPGLENLSVIPGNVGTSPMQNIGAYGVEIKECFEELYALEIKTGESYCFTKEECDFDYRYSVFKGPEKGRFIITSVVYRLSKKAQPNTSYGAVKGELERKGVENASIHDIAEAVTEVRNSKLPDPRRIGNAGSFFKNPVVDQQLFADLQERYPNIPNYPAREDKVKLAAGWLIEQSGWKGKRIGDAGVHEKQALVLVNYGGASGSDILNVAKQVQADVKQKFGVELEMEVNII